MAYTPTPVLLILQPPTSSSTSAPENITSGSLPVKTYEPTVEFRDRKTYRAFIEARYDIQTGEAERIAVDWTAKGGGGGTSCGSLLSPTFLPRGLIRVSRAVDSHLSTQKAAVSMLHDRVKVIAQYVKDVAQGSSLLSFHLLAFVCSLRLQTLQAHLHQTPSSSEP